MLQQAGLLLLLHHLGLCGQMLVPGADVCSSMTAVGAWRSDHLLGSHQTSSVHFVALRSIHVYPWRAHPKLSDC